MKTHTLLPYLCGLLMFSSCSTMRYQTEKNKFSYKCGDNDCLITSINTRTGEGSNFLVIHTPDGDRILNAGDVNQDGTIDQIISGDLTIDEADQIYKKGIIAARKMGNYSERLPQRTYEYTSETYHFVIQTYRTDNDTPNNLFVMTDLLSEEEFIFLDEFADGKLDRVKKGTLLINMVQADYEAAIKKGLEQKKIYLNNGTYLVIKKSEKLPS